MKYFTSAVAGLILTIFVMLLLGIAILITGVPFLLLTLPCQAIGWLLTKEFESFSIVNKDMYSFLVRMADLAEKKEPK